MYLSGTDLLVVFTHSSRRLSSIGGGSDAQMLAIVGLFSVGLPSGSGTITDSSVSILVITRTLP